MNPPEKRIAYFSMEIALDPAMPTYNGGLGILAGDTLRAAAELSVPIFAVTPATRAGLLSAKARCKRLADKRAGCVGGRAMCKRAFFA
jgi:glucan phosphorylase